MNIDDYGRIDAHVGQSGIVFGWYNGDFNFDAKINPGAPGTTTA